MLDAMICFRCFSLNFNHNTITLNTFGRHVMLLLFFNFLAFPSPSLLVIALKKDFSSICARPLFQFNFSSCSELSYLLFAILSIPHVTWSQRFWNLFFLVHKLLLENAKQRL